MIANLIILAIVFGYCGYVIFYYNKKKKTKAASGCTGHCSCCSGCSGMMPKDVESKGEEKND